MVEHEQLFEALSEFARSVAGRFAIADVLHDLTRRVTAVVQVAGAGVSLQTGSALRFVTALDERTSTVERVQDREQAGPCIDAWRSGEVVAIPDLDQVQDRWPDYVRTASGAGIRSVASIPLNGARDCIGALDLYATSPLRWSDEDVRAATVLADIATSYVVHASELDRQRRINEQLEVALKSRVAVEQAKGILAAERNISVDEAFDALRRHARNHNASLRSVAEAVVSMGLRPT